MRGRRRRHLEVNPSGSCLFDLETVSSSLLEVFFPPFFMDTFKVRIAYHIALIR